MKPLHIILVAISTVAASHAATVTWSAAIDTGLADASGTPLAQNNWLQIGYFATLSNAQIAADASSRSGMSALVADFRVFASTQVGANTGAPGTFAQGSSPLYSSLPVGFANSQIYFWALDSTDVSSLSAAENTATAQAIGYLPKAADSNWQFPATDTSPPGGSTIDVNALVNGTMLAGTYQSVGGAAMDQIFGSGSHSVQLAPVVSPVPEPATVGFGLLTILAAAGVRTRRRA